uniref:SufB protein n=1 Tax=Olisthodiscus luteus TaxID=83000 RepID=A0A7U0KSU6_OLILU|nr:sufB protein [Olisthodiscus luteus]QQW50556.1 sufB protein [Olisthodiscus luteus]
MSTKNSLKRILSRNYQYGFKTDIETERIKSGLNKKIIYLISKQKDEPSFMLEYRLNAYRFWKKLNQPTWAYLDIPEINYQDIVYYCVPKKKKKLKSLDEVDSELLDTFEKLGISLSEQKRLANVAVDAVFDSVSITTTFKAELAKFGIIFCSISEAIKIYPNLVKKYLSQIIPVGDNYFAALNSAVFTDGSFCYIPKNKYCPLELSTYFRINDENSGQFERTLIIAEPGSTVSYLEGCTAPQFDSNQLHAAVVELLALDNAKIKYSTVQNWYSGNEKGQGGIYNFVTKRGQCNGINSSISWTQVETGSAITWKYPSCILAGKNTKGEFYSIALTNNYQQADTGTKMIHFGSNSKSQIISKGISASKSKNSYRGLIEVNKKAFGIQTYSQCDSLLIGNESQASTFPYFYIHNSTAKIEHEASTSKIGEEQLFYFQQRGIETEEAISFIVSGFCSDIFNHLPMEFATEADKLLNLKLEGTIG